MSPRPACDCSAQVAALRDAVAGVDLTLREVLSLLRQAPSAPHAAAPGASGYPRVVTELTAAVVQLVPPDSPVLIVSRGDDRLLALDGRPAGHFPQSATGEYAGHHPRDSEAAIDELERLSAAGWRYLVFPSTALWWLDHYTGLRLHLETSGRLLLRQDGLGVVYGLSARAAPATHPALEPTS